jgi:hypothetical protein
VRYSQLIARETSNADAKPAEKTAGPESKPELMEVLSRAHRPQPSTD